MPDFLETTVDKFIFKVASDRHYTSEGVWAAPLDLTEGRALKVRVGVSDFLQQRSGDVAFVEVRPVGTRLSAGDEIASLETIKVDVSLASPVSGTIVGVNQAACDAPDVINREPYGAGWLAVVDVTDWPADRARLLDPQAYFSLMKGQAEAEMLA